MKLTNLLEEQSQGLWHNIRAKKILNERGKEINTEDLKQIIDETETNMRSQTMLSLLDIHL